LQLTEILTLLEGGWWWAFPPFFRHKNTPYNSKVFVTTVLDGTILTRTPKANPTLTLIYKTRKTVQAWTI